MNNKLISPEELDAAVSLRDLSDPSHGEHAMQILLHLIHLAREL